MLMNRQAVVKLCRVPLNYTLCKHCPEWTAQLIEWSAYCTHVLGMLLLQFDKLSFMLQARNVVY